MNILATKKELISLRDEKKVLNFEDEALSFMAGVVMTSVRDEDSLDKFRETFQWLIDHVWMAVSFDEQDFSFIVDCLRKTNHFTKEENKT